MEKSVEKFYGEHYKYMQRAMWRMEAAIGEAARFSKAAIVSTDEFIKGPDCKTGIDAALNADDTINVMVIVDSKSDATTIMKWLHNVSYEHQMQLKHSDEFLDAKNQDGFYGIYAVFEVKSKDNKCGPLKVQVRISTPVLDCIAALEKCCESEEVKQLLEVYKKMA